MICENLGVENYFLQIYSFFFHPCFCHPDHDSSGEGSATLREAQCDSIMSYSHSILLFSSYMVIFRIIIKKCFTSKKFWDMHASARIYLKLAFLHTPSTRLEKVD